MDEIINSKSTLKPISETVFIKRYIRRNVFSLSLMIILFVVQTNFAQYINKGMWYHQQPTSPADNGIFFGGSATYEGWCGPSALAMAFHYFIPNIHKILYDKYGAVDYHSSDNRGGLTSTDPYCYKPSTTYPFGDFLAHKYLGYHVTTSGVGYSELMTIIAGVDKDVDSYTANYGYVPFSKIDSCLDNKYLIVMNTIEDHYILVTGWGKSTTNINQKLYYIWDGWKNPLGMEFYNYRTDLVGNKSNLGTSKNISVYTISESTLHAHFRDQVGDGSVLAVKFTLVNAPKTTSEIGAKGIVTLSSTIRNMGAAKFINDIHSHGITNLFMSVKGDTGCIEVQLLKDVIQEAHLYGIKVHACVDVLKDKVASLSGNYSVVGESWIDANDVNYRNYFFNNIVDTLCSLDIDGLQLDSLRYPGNAIAYSNAAEAISEYCRLIRQRMDNRGKSTAMLSVSIMPEGEKTLSLYGQDVSTLAKYTNIITLTTFTHNYMESPDWVGNQVAYFSNLLSNGCKVWSGIQALDEDGNYLTSYEFKQCVDFAFANGSSGIVYFRYPIESWQWETSDKLTITSISDKEIKGKKEISDSFELSQNYPNPFNPSTTICYTIPEAGNVKVMVYDILGREIEKLVDENKNACKNYVKWDGSKVASGVYFYSLSFNNLRLYKKMIITK